MTPRLLASLGAAALLTAIPRLAGATEPAHDDALRPDAAGATWTTVVDGAPVVTPDVTYPGPQQSVVSRPQRAPATLATDDAIYPPATSPAPTDRQEQATGTARAGEGATLRPGSQLACGCTRD